jgi:hypothetical protein
LVILGIAVFIASPSAGKPESGKEIVFHVDDSVTKQPVSGATLSIIFAIPGVGLYPPVNIYTNSSGLASSAALSSNFSIDVIKQGYQEYYAQDLAVANTYVIHLGITNVTSTIEAVNSTRGGGFALPSLSLGQLGGAIVVATGVVVLAVAVSRGFHKSHPQ